MMLEMESKETPAAESNQAQVTAGQVSTNTLQVPSGASVCPPLASIHFHSPAPPATVDEDESEDESDILDESLCGRWQKRKEEVNQRNVPGIDAAYLAMDTEEGVEVVWNEVMISERKNFKLLEARDGATVYD